jgi:S1-C subfamily serine protease
VAAPDPRVVGDPDIVRAGRSVVRVLGTACGLGVEGSGWIAVPGLIVTNAHVVAGEGDTSITTRSGASYDATVVHYDPENDLALLQADVTLPPLALAADGERGEPGAVLGYPNNGPFSATAARFGDVRDVISENSYGEGPVPRRIASLRGSVRSGNSGGPLVDTDGRVLGTVFATTTEGTPGGFAVPDDTVREALGGSLGPVGTGACTA